jgi:hypothetical protein
VDVADAVHFERAILGRPLRVAVVHRAGERHLAPFTLTSISLAKMIVRP